MNKFSTILGKCLSHCSMDRWIVFALFMLFGLNNVCAKQSCYSLMEKTWREFRAIHPFGFQTIALKHYGQDTCVFVMSEPPSWVSQSSIKKLFNSYGGNIGIGRHTWGYDGILTDLIGIIKCDKTKFPLFESDLFKLFYGTNYKHYYTDLDKPVSHTYCLSDTPNYSVNIVDLYEMENARVFVGYLWGGEKPSTFSITSCQTLQGTKNSCIYYSKEPGYVAWIFKPNMISMADSLFRSDARQFLLDTDIIIGAIPSRGGLALIGRERLTPVDVLPPLRAETIQLLSQHVSDTLYVHVPSDSIRCVDDTTYIAPIEMSESLKHSDIGNLMILASDLLLSYATNNQVKDYFLEGYPQPIINTAALSSINETGSLLWYPNFDGCLHSNAIGEVECLDPMFYKNADNSMQIMEDDSYNAYDYFTRIKNIDLLRAKQYAFVFQALKMQSFFTGIPHQAQSNDNETWINAPSTIVTNAPFAEVSFIMQ